MECIDRGAGRGVSHLVASLLQEKGGDIEGLRKKLWNSRIEDWELDLTKVM